MVYTTEQLKNATLMQLVDWGFDHYQMGEIIKGLESGVDVSAYADPKCSVIQMGVIRKRLEDEFYPAQIAIIRKGQEAGVDVTIFADRKFESLQMEGKKVWMCLSMRIRNMAMHK